MVVPIGNTHHHHQEKLKMLNPSKNQNENQTSNDNRQQNLHNEIKDEVHKNDHRYNQQHHRQHYQELIDNCKEFRLDKNNHHIRIIGNDNRVCLNQNNGSLEVIGNDIRIKIVKNCGEIFIYGNNGKVYLGEDSMIKQVNYIGNNGLLKLVNDIKLKEHLTKKLLYSKSKILSSMTITMTSLQSSPTTKANNSPFSKEEKVMSTFSLSSAMQINKSPNLIVGSNFKLFQNNISKKNSMKYFSNNEDNHNTITNNGQIVKNSSHCFNKMCNCGSGHRTENTNCNYNNVPVLNSITANNLCCLCCYYCFNNERKFF